MSNQKTKYNTHLKKCLKCNSEYWAQKRNSKFCSKKCSISFRNTNDLNIRKKISESLTGKKNKSQTIESNQKRSIKTKIQWKNKRQEMIMGQKLSYKKNPNIVLKRVKICKQNILWRKNLSIASQKNWKEKPEVMMKAIFAPVNKRNSQLEKDFEKYCIKNNIAYQKQYTIKNKFYDFYLNEINTLIEIDDTNFWHPYNKKENFYWRQIQNLANDIEKNELAINNNYNILRISSIDNEKSLEEMSYYINKSGIENINLKFKWEYDAKIFTKEYLSKLTVEERKFCAKLLLRFIRNNNILFEHLLPKPNLEQLNYEIFKLKKSEDTNYQFINQNNEVLKSYFPNLYNTINNYAHIKKSTKEAFYDDNLLLNVLEYRCGVKNELFNITPKEIIRGINSYYRTTPSFFPAKLAYQVYKKNCKEGDIVYDPSFGFGGRMLGAIANNLSYHGTDPNIETYKNILNLKNDIDYNNIFLENICSEDYIKELKFDFIFTSIPYFNTEIYSNENTQSYNRYRNIDDWKKNYLIKTLVNCRKMLKDDKYICIQCNDFIKNIILNCIEEINLQFAKEEIIKSKTSHFNNCDVKNEFLIYIYKK